MPPRPVQEYQVGWVCALPKELTAARAMLDEENDDFKSQVPQDNNNYVLGRIHEHNVVLACLPAGVYGTVSAATVANNMQRTFTEIRFGLMVGIGGGIPNLDKGADIRLGDVVVSQPDGTHGGVVQFDLGRNLGEGIFERKGFLRPPPTLLLTALAKLHSQHQMYGNHISDTLSEMIKRLPRLAKAGYVYPGPEKDSLHCSNVEDHKDGKTCTQCLDGMIHREPRDDKSPEVHYGIIASGNELMKNVVERDRLGREFGAKCIEMEAAGLMNDFPCIVVRGICDYADSHKNDVWQEYAAVTAAAFAHELLSVVRPMEVASTKCAAEVMKYSLGLNFFDAPDMGDGLFIGRETEMQQMETILQPDSESSGSTRTVVVLGGMGGIGKTQLAITYAKQHRSSYSSIFWLNANAEATMKNSMRAVANRILSPETVSKLEDEHVLVHVSNWLSQPDNIRWLLILDNHDDPDQYAITKYYPSASYGSIIITTRQPDRVNGEKIKVRSMTKEEESLRILATRSGRDDVISDPDARKLAERLDGHPLALATAGAFLSQSSLNFTKYLKQYELKWKVTDSIKELSDYPSRTLYTTWNLSFTQIEQENTRAATLLRFLAYLDHQDIWYELLQGGQGGDQPQWFTELASDEFVFEDAIQTLTRYSLVESHHQTGSYSLHVCVHDWTLNGLNHHVDAIHYWLAVDCIAGHVSDAKWNDLSAFSYRRFNRHAEQLLHHRVQNAVNRHTLRSGGPEKLGKIANLLAQQVQHKAAERMYLQTLTWKEVTLGHDHISTLRTINDLGNLYRDQSKLAKAEQMLLQALARKEEALGPDHISTLETINCLGLLYRDQGKLNEAEQMYLRALDSHKKALRSDHASALNTVNNLGIVYHDQGKLDEAKKMFLQTLAGKEKANGLNHTSTLDAVNNLGLLYRKQGKLAEAEEMFLRTLAGKEKTLGPDHKSTLDSFNNLGLLYSDQGKLIEAEKMYLRAMNGQKMVLGLDHTSTLMTISNLGMLYHDQGKLIEAEEMHMRALAGREKVLGLNHTSTLDTLNSLGVLYRSQGKLAEAERMYLQTLARLEKVLGSNHTSTLATVLNLGVLYQDQGKVAEAEQMSVRALTGFEMILGPDHTSTLNVVNNLGVLYRGQGKLIEAEEMYIRALTGREKVLGLNHTSTLATVLNLGLLYRAQDKVTEAEQMFVRALTGFETVLGPDHTSTIKTVNNLRMLYRDQGKLAEAEEMYMRAVPRR